MQVAGQDGAGVHRELSPHDEVMDCSVEAPRDDVLPLRRAAGSVGGVADSSRGHSLGDAGSTARPRLCEDHISGLSRGCVAEGNGASQKNPTPTQAPPSPHLPSEWSLVHRSLKGLLLRSCASATCHSPPIAEGCATFVACIARSRQYALKIDIDALETVGKAQLALGKGLDSAIMSEHISLVRRVGFRAALHELSLTLLDHSSTSHPFP